jgi:hypothetical protein
VSFAEYLTFDNDWMPLNKEELVDKYPSYDNEAWRCNEEESFWDGSHGTSNNGIGHQTTKRDAVEMGLLVS